MFPNYTKYCIKTVDWRAVFLFQEQQINFLKIMFIKVESGIYLFGFFVFVLGFAFFSIIFYKVQQLLKRSFHHKEQADSLYFSWVQIVVFSHTVFIN